VNSINSHVVYELFIKYTGYAVSNDMMVANDKWVRCGRKRSRHNLR
jgi:hypothetical protein